ncbi:MAG: TonB-dependent receptor, partial [Chitinophagaceae bacterium]
MKYSYSFLLFSILSLGCLQSFSQKENADTVSLNLKDAPIKIFVSELEKQTGYYFYYNSAQFDSITFTISIVKQPLQKVLDLVMVNCQFFYAIDNDKHIFLTGKQGLDFSLPQGYFLAGKENKNAQNPEGNIEREEGDGLKPEQRAALENKLYEIGIKTTIYTKDVATLAGYIADAKTGEPIVGASVFIEKLKIGVTTDQYGYYSLSLPRGRHLLNIQSLGMKDTRRQLLVNNDGKLNIDLQGTVMTLRSVTISAQKISNVKGTRMGLQKIDIKTIKQVPVIFGEADILRIVTTLPGVKTVGEASTGLNVRGGASDQNLILFNDATIFNPSHFFGLFSAFNPEIVKDVELYKSSIPARYGGRLASVLNINSREGNKKNITGSAGVGLLTSRLQLEGPLIKDKSSFIVAGRTTYANWLLNLLPDQYKNSKASFYDLNLNITHEFNKKNTLYITGYLSRDQFNLNSDTSYGYGNTNFSIKWKHVFNNKLNSLITGGYDRYEYKIASEELPLSAYTLGFDINQTFFKAHFNYYLNSKHTVDFGVSSIYYQLHPGSFKPIGSNSLVVPEIIGKEQALESALYINDRYSINNSFSLEGGIRYSIFNSLGAQTINTYAPGLPLTLNNKV